MYATLKGSERTRMFLEEKNRYLQYVHDLFFFSVNILTYVFFRRMYKTITHRYIRKKRKCLVTQHNKQKAVTGDKKKKSKHKKINKKLANKK